MKVSNERDPFQGEACGHGLVEPDDIRADAAFLPQSAPSSEAEVRARYVAQQATDG